MSSDSDGVMLDVLKRIGVLESSVSELKAQVAAALPHLATKADLAEGLGALRAELTGGLGALRAELTGGLGALRAELTGGLGALRAELTGDLGALRSEISAMETRIIKWTIATAVATGSLAFTIAKFVH